MDRSLWRIPDAEWAAICDLQEGREGISQTCRRLRETKRRRAPDTWWSCLRRCAKRGSCVWRLAFLPRNRRWRSNSGSSRQGGRLSGHVIAMVSGWAPHGRLGQFVQLGAAPRVRDPRNGVQSLLRGVPFAASARPRSRKSSAVPEPREAALLPDRRRLRPRVRCRDKPRSRRRCRRRSLSPSPSRSSNAARARSSPAPGGGPQTCRAADARPPAGATRSAL